MFRIGYVENNLKIISNKTYSNIFDNAYDKADLIS